MNQFEIQTETFEGPLELLLRLVEKKKLHITDISLSDVADEFIEHIESEGSFPAENASQFIVIASTLILIKSKALLPYLELTDEEEENIEELEIRLKIFKEIKEIGAEILNLYGKEPIFQTNPPPQEIRFSPSENLNIDSIFDSVSQVLNTLPSKEKKPEKQVKKVISLEEMINRLEGRIKKAVSMSFEEFSDSDKASRIDVVVSFLAVLELVKRGLMDAKQEGRFGEIQMETQTISTPKYGG